VKLATDFLRQPSYLLSDTSP